VFDTSTGRILDEPEISAIEGIRQIAYTFKKLLVPCATRRVRKALEEFIRIEHSLEGPEQGSKDLEVFLRVSDHLWGSLLTNFAIEDLIPRHGPGATAERISGNQKYVMQRWHDRLEPWFPMLSFAFANEYASDTKEFERLSVIPECDEQPVRVITVPKTLKTPRIIAIEPVCMQYMQQAISRWLTRTIEQGPITRGHVNFHDQSVNRSLAMSASRERDFATLDLSSASDRVPYAIAIRMFDMHPDLQGCISATRSTRAKLPDGQVLTLKKFASMGSALCFPIEAMYFYTICIVALLEKYDLPVTFSNIRSVAKLVYVYGDDIIVPTDTAESVSYHLQKYSCKVNSDKSFWTGKFRESCGLDAYDGQEVTPTYVRHLRPSNRGEASSLASWVAAANHFYKRGYWSTASHMISVCESILGALPIIGPECAGLGKVSFQHCVSATRWNVDHQVHEVRTWCAVPIYRKDKLEGHGALLKFFLSSDNNCQKDEKHLERTARHGAVALKRRWVRPY